MSRQAGCHCLKRTDCTNVPSSVVAVIARPTIDHHKPGFGILGRAAIVTNRTILGLNDRVVIYAASAISAWKATLSNRLAPSGGAAVRT